MSARGAALALLLLAGCSAGPARPPEDGAALEQAAIAAGLVADPGTGTLVGLYARDTDRLCVVPGDAGADRIGVSIDYGEGQGCSARGTVARSGDVLRIDLGRGCDFAAQRDGDAIAFPAQLPAACDRYCTERASLTALAADRQSDAAAEAARLRDAAGRALCGS